MVFALAAGGIALLAATMLWWHGRLTDGVRPARPLARLGASARQDRSLSWAGGARGVGLVVVATAVVVVLMGVLAIGLSQLAGGA